jgi:DNA-binding MarR family transcriptional regulator
MERARDSIAHVLDEWAAVRPDLDVGPVGIIARMARIRSIVDAEQSRVFTAAGITSADFPVLVTLRRRVPPYRTTHTQLAEDLALTPGTVTARVDRLVQPGFVTRETDEADARVRWVELTTAGLRLVDRLIPRHLAVEEELLAGISVSRRRRMARDLSALLADLESRYR